MNYQIDSSVIEASGMVLNATMTELMRLHARLKADLAKRDCDDGTTHNPNCYDYGRRHYDCALRKIKELEAELAECKEGKIRLRAAIKCERSSGQCMAVHECHRGMCTVENCHFIQNEKLREELTECKKDVERYNFLRKGCVLEKWPPEKFPLSPWCIRMEIEHGLPTNKPIDGVELDQAIDAAMSRGGE